MHVCYRDILDRIETPPLWFDEYAVPRYAAFSPRLTADIYGEEAALVLIECQGCGTEFKVAFSNAEQSTTSDEIETTDGRPLMLSDLIAACALEYGDPPNIECCVAGPSMSSVPRRVLEYWVKPVARGEGVERHPKLGVMVVKELTATEFIRDPAYEIDITPDWAL